jgi:hypothetical protein
MRSRPSFQLGPVPSAGHVMILFMDMATQALFKMNSDLGHWHVIQPYRYTSRGRAFARFFFWKEEEKRNVWNSNGPCYSDKPSNTQYGYVLFITVYKYWFVIRTVRNGYKQCFVIRYCYEEQCLWDVEQWKDDVASRVFRYTTIKLKRIDRYM